MGSPWHLVTSIVLLISIGERSLVRADCGPPPEIENGSVEWTSSEEGAKAVYSCMNPDVYRVKGDATAVCVRGAWTGSRTCEAFIQIPSRPPCIRNPPFVPHAQYSITHDNNGVFSARYTCAANFTLIGDSAAVCRQDIWTGKRVCAPPKPETPVEEVPFMLPSSSSSYILVINSLGFDGARAYCQNKSMDLTSLSSGFEMMQVCFHILLNKMSFDKVWISAQVDANGTWVDPVCSKPLASDLRFEFGSAKPSEPACGALVADRVQHIPCSDARAFVCETVPEECRT